MQTQGKKEVLETVLIAVLCTAATQLVSWGFEAVRDHFKGPEEKKDKEEKDKA